MKQYYTDYLKSSTPPGGFFAAKKEAVNITGYNSGKVLFQGANSEKEAAVWKSKASIVAPKKKRIVRFIFEYPFTKRF